MLFTVIVQLSCDLHLLLKYYNPICFQQGAVSIRVIYDNKKEFPVYLHTVHKADGKTFT